MDALMDFIRNNYLSVVIIVIVVIVLLVIIDVTNIDLNAPKSDTKLVQQVTVISDI